MLFIRFIFAGTSFNMKIAIAQQNYHIGNFDSNAVKILAAIDQARQNGMDLIVFSELAVCGYPPRDFLEFSDFINRCHGVLEQIKAQSKGIAIAVGCPTVNPKTEGKDLFNSAYFILDGEVLHIANKALLPTYDIFDEYRYFEPSTTFETFVFKGKRIALTICEDIWNVGNENPLYPISPMDELVKQRPDVMINLSASPFHFNQANERIHTLKANAGRYNLPIFYSNCIGAQTELIFDGGSLVMDASGNIIDELPYFEEALRYYELPDNNIPVALSNDKTGEQPKQKIELIYGALVLGIKDYFSKLGFKKAILGLSGGVDSALVLTLAVHALGKENVRSVLMPSQYSSDHSIDDAIHLAKNLGSPYEIVPIRDMYQSYMDSIGPLFEGKPFDVTEENIQARIRANILMALSNKFGYIVLNTSNKSETAVGYGTLYGDMCGGLSVIGDLYKTEIYALCRYINREKEIIPANVLVKAPSAELRPNQKDSDSLPEYHELDQVLYQYIEKRQGPNELIAMGFDKALVTKTLRLVNINEFKRHQTPPILRVSSKAFGVGRRMPIVGKYLS